MAPNRLFVGGTIYDTVDFKAECDFAGDGSADFKDVYIGLVNLPYVENIKAGHVKEPYSL